MAHCASILRSSANLTRGPPQCVRNESRAIGRRHREETHRYEEHVAAQLLHDRLLPFVRAHKVAVVPCRGRASGCQYLNEGYGYVLVMERGNGKRDETYILRRAHL